MSTRRTGSRALIYDRVSQADPTSQAEHLRRCRQFADARGWDVVAEFVDTASGFDRSAKALTTSTGLKVPVTRPGWLGVVEAVERGDVDHVVVFAVSRAGRNLAAFAQFVELCRDRGVTFASATEPIDSAGPFGIVFQALLSAMAELESATKRERALLGEEAHRRLGTFRGGNVPFGFRVADRDGRRYLEVDPVVAVAIRAGASRILNGETLVSVARRWNERGHLPNAGSGRPWDGSHVRDVLLGRSMVPAILTVSDQRRLADVFGGRRLGRAPSRYQLSGLAFCAVDGTRLRGGDRKYGCHSPDGKRLHLTVSADALEAYVYEEVFARALERPYKPVEARDPTDALVAERERLAEELRDLGRSSLPLAALEGRAERLQEELLAVEADLEQARPAARNVQPFLVANPDLDLPEPDVLIRQHVLRVDVGPAISRYRFDPSRVQIHWRGEEAPKGFTSVA